MEARKTAEWGSLGWTGGGKKEENGGDEYGMPHWGFGGGRGGRVAVATLAPPRRKETPAVRTDDGTGGGFDWDSQVVLFNDDVHEIGYVIACLMAVFGHGERIAAEITMEAHRRGRAIAEVEARAEAEKHAAALRKMGLGASVESIG